MKIKKREEIGRHRYDRMDVPKGEIKPDRYDGTLVWQKVDGVIYITCAQCNSINIIDDGFSINFEGAVGPCVICNHCASHNFFVLLGWAGVGTMVCARCLRSAKMTLEEFNKGGWVSKTGVLCRCCKSTLCPTCKDKV